MSSADSDISGNELDKSPIDASTHNNNNNIIASNNNNSLNNNNSNGSSNGDSSGMAGEASENGDASLPIESDVTSERHGRKRRLSNESFDSSSKAASDAGGDDVRDDDADDDEDDDEKLMMINMDPERLKAFNMFVRLFVDENLDRIVPISKQPKDKINAILEACDRQFPEFHERSRKRIRTYLKSCRRLRRSKEAESWETLRPTPPHLTSAAAETILALACENESNNAKRMRMGLEPIPACYPLPVAATASPTATAIASSTVASNNVSRSTPRSESTHTSSVTPVMSAASLATNTNPFFASVANGMLRGNTTNFASAFSAPGMKVNSQNGDHVETVRSSTAQPAVQSFMGSGGPTDLSMKKIMPKTTLNGGEVATIKQLIAGYRESAAFLYRSADELEALLHQHN